MPGPCGRTMAGAQNGKCVSGQIKTRSLRNSAAVQTIKVTTVTEGRTLLQGAACISSSPWHFRWKIQGDTDSVTRERISQVIFYAGVFLKVEMKKKLS